MQNTPEKLSKMFVLLARAVISFKSFTDMIRQGCHMEEATILQIFHQEKLPELKGYPLVAQKLHKKNSSCQFYPFIGR